MNSTSFMSIDVMAYNYSLVSSFQASAILSEKSSLTIAFTIFIFTAFLWSCWNSGFPIVGSYSNLNAAIKEGSKKYPNKAFALPTSPNLIILPHSTIGEIKNLREAKISAVRELFRRAGGHYSKVGTNTIAGLQAIRIDLARDMAKVVISLQDECKYAFANAIGPCQDWTLFPTNQVSERIVALVSGRIFVGMPLSRDERWVQLTIDWTSDIMLMVHTLAWCPTLMKSLVAPYLPVTKRILKHRELAKFLLGPMLEAGLQSKGAGSHLGVDNSEGNVTLADWILKYIDNRHSTVEGLVRQQLALLWAANFTTAQFLAQAIFDLAAHPDCQQVVREEVDVILRENRGQISKGDISKLVKLDSFMKESQRFNPGTAVTMMRLTTAPLALSTGQIVPPGTPVGVYSSVDSNSILDSTPTDVFDGMRFYKRRQRVGQENMHQFLSTGPKESLHFGYGNHTCPGRFFANAELKIVLAYLLHHYEVRLKDGERRPENLCLETWIAPNPSAEVLFKGRKSQKS